jgi:hypothetical protein
MYLNILGLNQLPRLELTSGVTIIVGCSALTYCTIKLWRYAAIAPYPSLCENRVTGALQRAIIDKTKTKVDEILYPLDCLRTNQPRRTNENGHAKSGAVRDAARILIDETIKNAGAIKFEINPNKRSSVGKRSHFHFAVSDLEQDFENGEPDKNSILVGIDIDYYITEPSVLLQYMRPVILHTFNPKQVSGFDADSPFTIINNVVEYKVSGGATWNHHVWDWCEAGEFISARVKLPWYLRLLGLIGLEKVGYHKIQHSRPWKDCPNRALVYTIPQCTVWRFKSIPSEITVRDLKKINYEDPTKPGWNRIEFLEDEQLKVNVGRAGDHLNVTIERSQLDMLMNLSSTQSVNARLISLGHKDPLFSSTIVQYYTGKLGPFYRPPTVYNHVMPRVHWPVTSEADRPEITARQYTKPILSDSMLVPMIRRWETMSESIERRVTFVKNDKLPSNNMARKVDEFVELVNGGISDLHPLSIEDTVDRLNKPSQQLQLRVICEVLGVEPRDIISSFNKNEPGMKSSRIISGFADIMFILQVSRYTLAYTDSVLKAEHNKHWYFPGRTPSEIVDGVREFVVQCDAQVIETDFSNLDGRVSGWMQRNVAQRAMMQAFDREHHDEIRKFMDSIINCPAQAKKFGFRYDPGVGVKSGSPTTTPHNTMYNACVEYAALRFVLPDVGNEYAFAMIGPKSGDDGIANAIVHKSIDKAARGFGLELKSERYNPEIGLCFLSRVFIDPLNTETTIQDPLRTLRKLHLTTRDPTVPLADAACDRVEGYLCTDAYTPLIGDYCKMVLRLYAPHAKSQEERQQRRSYNKEKPYWLTCDGSWPQNPNETDVMLEIISKRTKIDKDKIQELIGRFVNTEDIWEDFTHDSEESEACHTIDEDGIMPDSVDVSFTQLQHAKQTRSDPAATTARLQRTKASMGDEVRGCTTKRAEGSGQPNRVPKKNEHPSQRSRPVNAKQTNSTSVPRRSPTSSNSTAGRQAKGPGKKSGKTRSGATNANR